MTAQIPDKVYYQDSEYTLIGVKGENLPTPATYGMQPIMWSTACYRGYVATYNVNDSGLYLKALHIGRIHIDSEWKPIAGIEPEAVYREGYTIDPEDPEKRIQKRWSDGRIYNDLNEPTYFSGGLLVARGFISSLYVHMGFGKPYQFEEVYEFLFHEGNLVKEIDHSEKAAEMRAHVIADNEAKRRKMEELKAQGYSGKELTDKVYGSFDGDSAMKGIEWRFSMDYGKWF